MPLADGFAPTAVALQDPLILHGPTKLRSWVDCSTSCCDAFCVSVAPACCALRRLRHTRSVARDLAAALRRFVHIGGDESSGTRSRRLAACPCYMLSNYAGKRWPRVSSPNGIRSSASAKAIEVIATGVPSEPKCRTPAPTRKVIPAPPNRANEVENANALARHSVGYCSGSQRV
jgi:hypothetical protein